MLNSEYFLDRRPNLRCIYPFTKHCFLQVRRTQHLLTLALEAASNYASSSSKLATFNRRVGRLSSRAQHLWEQIRLAWNGSQALRSLMELLPKPWLTNQVTHDLSPAHQLNHIAEEYET